MAVVQTDITPTPLRNGFSGRVPGAPIGELLYSARNTSVPSPGAGNNNLVVFECFLPRGNSYTFQEASVAITASVAGQGVNYGSIAPGVLADAESATDRTYDYHYQLQTQGTGYRGGTPLQERIYQPVCALPSLAIHAYQDQGIARMWFWDNNANGNAATVDCFARFLVYPFEDAFRQNMNVSILTR